MSKTIRRKTSIRQQVRANRKKRIHRKLVLQKGRICRLVVYRSNRFIYAQVVDDLKGHTLVQANTQEQEFGQFKSKKKIEVAKMLGKVLAERAIGKNIQRVVFDRNGYDFHGRIKAVADGAREAGLNF